MPKSRHVTQVEAATVLAEVTRVLAPVMRQYELRPPILRKDWWYPSFLGEEKSPDRVVDYAIIWSPAPGRWTTDYRLARMVLPPDIEAERYNRDALGIYRRGSRGKW